MTPPLLIKAPMDDHHGVVQPRFRFPSRTIGLEIWDFSHLEAFAFKVELDLTPGSLTEVDVIVLFACHCFTRDQAKDEIVSADLIWNDGHETRVLDRERYDLSLIFLPRIVFELQQRRIQIADPARPNYVTFEIPPGQDRAKPGRYAVFFEVEKDTQRRKRLLLRIQSAYLLENPTKRLLKGDKINFRVLLKKAYNT
jgi:hypothetical protein